VTKTPAEGTWQVRSIGSRLPWGKRSDRAADIGDELCSVMLTRENVLEDANYQKIVPNHYVIEVGQENYSRNFRLLENQILQQWNQKLLDHLLTANSRQGRQEYRMAGPLKIELHSVPDLGMDQARIFCRVFVGENKPQNANRSDISACLEILPGGRRWPLRSGIVTMGRDTGCYICLDDPEIQKKKLVSSQHAYLVCKPDSCRLFDGAPNGKPSLNGTFVNLHRLSPNGYELKNGDVILLAALEPDSPSPDTPGVALLRFVQDCRS